MTLPGSACATAMVGQVPAANVTAALESRTRTILLHMAILLAGRAAANTGAGTRDGSKEQGHAGAGPANTYLLIRINAGRQNCQLSRRIRPPRRLGQLPPELPLAEGIALERAPDVFRAD